jgi:hypothetical protein
MTIIKFVAASSFLFVSGILAGQTQVKQQHLSRVDQMAAIPQPLQIIDYRALAQRFDATVCDFHATGRYWPLVWMDSSGHNFNQPVAGIYTAIGDVRQGPSNNKGIFHEALATMGATLGATLVGINKQEGLNYVGMLKNYFNHETGWDIMMNNTCPEVALLGGGYGRDWWYDVYPNVLFYAIYDLYPNEPGFTEIAHSIAEKFYKADSILQGNYNWSFFDYARMQPMKNNICAQPDASAGHAWVLYHAYKKFGDKRYLDGAISALRALESQKQNPTYELLMPFGAYLAARINAELDNNFDVQKLLKWSFDGTAICREGWGVLVGKWNGYDISGIVGSTVDHGGYGFLMNTYDAAWPLVPLVRYNKSYANAIGKWMLNAANASRLFYPQYMPKEHQALPGLASVTKGVIAYEGIIKRSSHKESASLKAPVAQGDGPLWVENRNPPETQFSVYGSGHAGIFGSIIDTTNVKGILRLDLLATDFYRDKAYPSYLYYNPYATGKNVKIKLPGAAAVDVYDAITGRFIATNVTSASSIVIKPQSSALITLVPAGGVRRTEGKKLLVDDVVVDYGR